MRRISYGGTDEPPVAVAGATPASGPVETTVSFSAAGSRDPEGGALSYAWDLDGDGSHDDATGPSASRRYTSAGRVVVGLQVRDPAGLVTRTTTVVDIGVSAPVLTTTPSVGSQTWTVGTTMS